MNKKSNIYGIKFQGDPQVYGERHHQFKPSNFRTKRLGYRPEMDPKGDGPRRLRRSSRDPDLDRMYEWALDHGINIRDEKDRQKLAQLVFKDAWERKKEKERRKRLAMLATSRGNFEGLPLELRHKIRSYRYNKKSKKKNSKYSKKPTLPSPKGWGKMAPKSGKERSRVYKKCGKKCFLKPNKRKPSQSKFPVCSKSSCKINCKGVTSAYIRSRQWRKKIPSYSKIATKAQKLSKRLCKVKTRTAGKKSKNKSLKKSKK